MCEEIKFEVGDEVIAFGVDGIVGDVVNDSDFPILVRFPNKHVLSFTKKGFWHIWHKEPSLKLIKKAKKPVKRWQWLCINDNGTHWLTTGFFEDELEVRNYTNFSKPLKPILETEKEFYE